MDFRPVANIEEDEKYTDKKDQKSDEGMLKWGKRLKIEKVGERQQGVRKGRVGEREG